MHHGLRGEWTPLLVKYQFRAGSRFPSTMITIFFFDEGSTVPVQSQDERGRFACREHRGRFNSLYSLGQVYAAHRRRQMMLMVEGYTCRKLKERAQQREEWRRQTFEPA